MKQKRTEKIGLYSRKSARGVVFALLAGICWGFSGTVGQYLFTYKNMNSEWLTVVRMVASGVILLIVAGIRDTASIKHIWLERKNTVRLILFALFGLMTVQLSYMETISYSNAGTATAIQYIGEALILIYTCIIMKRWPRLVELAALLLALLGIFLIATHGNFSTMVISPAGLSWGLISAVALMIYTVLPGKLITEFGSRTVIGYGMLIGGIVLAILIRVWNISVALDWKVMIAVLVIVLVGTIGAFTLFLKSVVDIGGVKAGLLASTEMLAASFFARIWLHTEFAVMDYLGFVCILLMVFLLAVPQKNIVSSAKE